MINSDDIKSHLEALKSLYRKGLVSVLIGAGFSKNVCSTYPSWDELLSDLVVELYERDIISKYDLRKNNIPDFKQSFNDFKDEYIKDIIDRIGHTKLVSLYINKKGYRESIEHYIEERIPYIDEENNQLHFCGKNKDIQYPIISDDLIVHTKLLEGSNWENIYTTNYDCLLEFAARCTNKDFNVITEAYQLSISKQQRSIIKLHGSLHNPNCKRKFAFDNSSLHQYIISEEDYQTYPVQHEAFTQLMRISLLQGTFCLIGFSGNDPNFSAWINWVRDLLIRKSATDNINKKIYIIDLNRQLPEESKYIYFENHNIAHIPLWHKSIKSIIGSEAKDNKTLLFDFFEYLYKEPFEENITDEALNNKYSHLWNKVYTEKIEGFPPKIIATNIDTPSINQLLEIKSCIRIPNRFSTQDTVLSRIYHKSQITQDELTLAILALEDLGYPISYYQGLTDKLKSINLSKNHRVLLTKLEERDMTLCISPFSCNYESSYPYENVLRAFFTLDFVKAESILNSWNPAGKDMLKKALFYSFFNADVATKITLAYIKDEPNFSEKLFATKLLNLFDRSFPPKYSTRKYENSNTIDYWKLMNSLFDNLGKNNFRGIKPYGTTQEKNIFADKKKTPHYEESVRILNYLLELPFLFTYHNYVIIRNNDDWYIICKNLFEDHPYAAMFYTLQCNNKSVITRISQDFAYSDKLTRYCLPEMLNRLLQAIINPKTPKFLIQPIFTFASELFISVDPDIWNNLFIDIWNIKFIPIIDNVDWHNEVFKFISKALPFINDSKTRLKIVKDCLINSKNCKDPTIIINILYHLQINRKDKRNIELIKDHIDQFIENISTHYDITISGNIRPLLTKEHIKKIKSNLKDLMSNVNTPEIVYRSAANFVRNNKSETKILLESLINNKKLWDNGILGKGQATGCQPIPISDIADRITIDTKYIQHMYIKLKDSYNQLIDSKNLDKESTILLHYDTLLFEMQYFLSKYQKELEEYAEYNMLTNSITEVYRNIAGFGAIEDGLYASDEIIFTSALYEMYKKRRAYSDEELNRYSKILINRILFVNIGGMETALNYLNALLVYKFINTKDDEITRGILKILDKYTKEMLQENNINVFGATKYLVSIANYLSKSGINSQGIEKWKNFGKSRRFYGKNDM